MPSTPETRLSRGSQWQIRVWGQLKKVLPQFGVEAGKGLVDILTKPYDNPGLPEVFNDGG